MSRLLLALLRAVWEDEGDAFGVSTSQSRNASVFPSLAALPTDISLILLADEPDSVRQASASGLLLAHGMHAAPVPFPTH
jgi:hypothetical protein